MKKLQIVCATLLILICGVSQAQNKISVSKRNPIYMDLTPSYSAGLSKKIITDDSQWLNYTTLVYPTDPTISITVEVSSGSIPDGMELQIEASQYIGMSKGKQGTSTGKLTVSHRPRVLINNIGTCYTGTGKYEGHRLTFSFIITDYAKVKSGISNIFIQYTITQ